MHKRFFLGLALWTATMILHQPAQAQYTTPYSTSSVQGSNIITNYYDPNAVNSGPGLPTSPLQSRFTQPLSTFGQQNSLSSLPPVQITGQPLQSTYNQNPLGTLPGQPSFQAPLPPTLPQQSSYRQQTSGPVILNPVNSYNTPRLPAHFEDPIYPYPGLLTRLNGRWIGSEYLYDLPRNIGIVIEVIKPGNTNIDIDIRGIRDTVSFLFSKSDIHPESLAIGEDPPLPFFHILILVYPDELVCTAAVSVRLMEKVKVSRLDFNTPGTSQAITWEKLELIITSLVQFPEQLQDTIRDITTTFLNRVNYFDEQRRKLNTGFRVQGCPQERYPEKSRIDCNCDYR